MKIDELLKEFESLVIGPEDVDVLRKFVALASVRGKFTEAKRSKLVLDSKQTPQELLLDLQSKKSQLKTNLKNVAIQDSGERPFHIPDSWIWCQIADVGEVIGGGTPSTDEKRYFANAGAGIPWLTPSDVGSKEISKATRGRRDITSLGLSNSGSRLLPKGAVLYTSRAPIGNVSIAENDLTTNQGFKSVIPYLPSMNEYIALYLFATREWVNVGSSGTTFKEISGKKLQALPFPLPSLIEQEKIYKTFKSLWLALDSLEASMTNVDKARRKTLASITQSILNDEISLE
jgi:type I restriction enzyme S subunit